MRRIAPWLAIAGGIAACDSVGDHPPVRPGSAGTGDMTPAADGGSEQDGGGTGVVSGRVCPIQDLRAPSQCDALQDPVGITVTEVESGNSTSSGPNGSFSVATASATEAQLRVSSSVPLRRQSLIGVDLDDGSASGVIAPIMLEDDYESLKLQLGVIESDDSASVVVYVRQGGLPARDVEAVPPAGTSDVFYDDDEDLWDPLGQTESRGAVLMLGVPVSSGLTDFMLVDEDGSIVENVLDVPVAAGATTFIRVSFR